MHDIHEVCGLLGTTSRTLRFYEEKGLITSTKTDSARRQYTDAQLEQIRRVLALRALGLPVKAIAALQHRDGDLRQAVLARRAEIIASIETRRREIQLLTDALAVLEAGDDLYAQDVRTPDVPSPQNDEIAARCARAVVEGDTEALYRHLGPKLTAYMPRDAYTVVRADTLEPLGEFVAYDRLAHDAESPRVVEQYVCYTRLGLKIRFVFHRGIIDGLWMGYYEI